MALALQQICLSWHCSLKVQFLDCYLLATLPCNQCYNPCNQELVARKPPRQHLSALHSQHNIVTVAIELTRKTNNTRPPSVQWSWSTPQPSTTSCMRSCARSATVFVQVPVTKGKERFSGRHYAAYPPGLPGLKLEEAHFACSLQQCKGLIVANRAHYTSPSKIAGMTRSSDDLNGVFCSASSLHVLSDCHIEGSLGRRSVCPLVRVLVVLTYVADCHEHLDTEPVLEFLLVCNLRQVSGEQITVIILDLLSLCLSDRGS